MSGSLWGWGGTPRGFSVNNGTLGYPADYYTGQYRAFYDELLSLRGTKKEAGKPAREAAAKD